MFEAINLQRGQNLLIRGGTSAAGIACAFLAKHHGCRVISTTRSEAKAAHLKTLGIDEVLIDDGNLAHKVKALVTNGNDGLVGFVGTQTTITDGLKAMAPKGTYCMVGFWGNQWDYKFFPWMPSTVKLTIYSTETPHESYATPVMQKIVDGVASGYYHPNIWRSFEFEQLPEAHDLMERNQAIGKLVIKV